MHSYQRKNDIPKRSPKAYRPEYQLKRMYWEFHAHDPDFLPSVPHGHSGKYKLNVITGEIIDTETGHVVAKLDKKDKNRLYKDKKFQSFARVARLYYLENNPGTTLPELDFLTTTSNVLSRHSSVNGRTGIRRIGAIHKRQSTRTRNFDYIFKSNVRFPR